jgi:hypothetical protein
LQPGSLQIKLTQQAKVFISGMEACFAAHTSQYANGKRLRCCSDIIESILGGYKNKAGMKAISADVLSIAFWRILSGLV